MQTQLQHQGQNKTKTSMNTTFFYLQFKKRYLQTYIKTKNKCIQKFYTSSCLTKIKGRFNFLSCSSVQRETIYTFYLKPADYTRTYYIHKQYDITSPPWAFLLYTNTMAVRKLAHCLLMHIIKQNTFSDQFLQCLTVGIL